MSTPYRASSAVDVAAPILARVRRLVQWAPLAYVAIGVGAGLMMSRMEPFLRVLGLLASWGAAFAWGAALGRLAAAVHALRYPDAPRKTDLPPTPAEPSVVGIDPALLSVGLEVLAHIGRVADLGAEMREDLQSLHRTISAPPPRETP